MLDKTKNPAPGAATPEREAETRAPGQATHISAIDNSTAEVKKQWPIASLLPRGAENALSTKDLAKIAGCGTTRNLRKLIEEERGAGALILSSTTGGYYLPDSGEKGRHELFEYVRMMRARALNTLKSAQAANKALESVKGQEILKGWWD